MRVRVKAHVKIPRSTEWLSHGVWYKVTDGFDLIKDCQTIFCDDGDEIIINADGRTRCGHLECIGGWEVE